LEAIFPFDRRWRMTGRSFRRDLKYLVVNGATLHATTLFLALLSVTLPSAGGGPLAGLPIPLAVPIALLVFESLQYWQHRLSHELEGPVGRVLWHVHVAHHLPDRVYVLMHAAGHPLNGFIVRGLVTIIPLWALGLQPNALLLVNMIIVLHGVLSHSNLDLRAGFANYLLVGPELHRFHHSADPREARNYAAVLSVLDLLFGTFVHRPGRAPDRLGVAEPDRYPRSEDIRQVLALPFRRTVSARPAARRP
jgi:sterol desaturase/sphingolipid hydroxylase (fatty acid hydroxylase superfamily)